MSQTIANTESEEGTSTSSGNGTAMTNTTETEGAGTGSENRTDNSTLSSNKSTPSEGLGEETGLLESIDDAYN